MGFTAICIGAEPQITAAEGAFLLGIHPPVDISFNALGWLAVLLQNAAEGIRTAALSCTTFARLHRFDLTVA
jgi:hypothetical protein